MPKSAAATIVRRTASAPLRCPATRGRPRALAQRPLPSMMIATWVGASLPLPVTARDFGTSDMKDVFFLGRQGLVDLLHHLVRELLDLGAPLAMFVFVDLVALLELLQRLHAVATDVAD